MVVIVPVAAITGDHSKEDLRCTQNLHVYLFLLNRIWSCLLWSPVIVHCRYLLAGAYRHYRRTTTLQCQEPDTSTDSLVQTGQILLIAVWTGMIGKANGVYIHGQAEWYVQQ